MTALESFRAKMGAMTPGPLPEPELRHGVEWYDIGDIARVLGFDDAVGFVAAVTLAQWLASDGAREAIARAIDPEAFYITPGGYVSFEQNVRDAALVKADVILDLLAKKTT